MGEGRGGAYEGKHGVRKKKGKCVDMKRRWRGEAKDERRKKGEINKREM